MIQKQLSNQELYDRDMAKVAEQLNELLDNAIYFQNFETMPTLVNIYSRAMYMTFRNLMVFHIND